MGGYIFAHGHIKIKWVNGDKVGVFPEYDSCRDIALKHGIPIQDVYRIAQQDAYTKFMKT